MPASPSWDFRDIPDRPATNGILKPLNTFTSSCAAVLAAVTPMAAGGGGDFAEAYNPVFHDAYTDLVLDASRGADAVQFLSCSATRRRTTLRRPQRPRRAATSRPRTRG